MAVQAKYKKSGDGGEDYTSFDNPVYGVEDDRISHVSASSQVSHAPFFSSKTLQRKYIYIGGAVLLVAVIIIIAIAVGVTVNQDRDEPHTVARPSASIQKNGATVSGEMRLTDKSFSDSLRDQSSPAYMNLSKEFIAAMDDLMKESKFKPIYDKTVIVQYKKGSVIVDFQILLTEPLPAPAFSDDQRSPLQQVVYDGIKKNGGYFAGSKVDMNSVILVPGTMLESPSTEANPSAEASPSSVTNPSTTVNPLSVTNSSVTTLASSTAYPTTTLASSTAYPTATVTSSKLQPSTTVTSAVTGTTTEKHLQQCVYPIVPQCAAVLDYNVTVRSPADQIEKLTVLLKLANETARCYQYSVYFVCSYVAPSCTNDTGRNNLISDFKLPCKHMCEDYKTNCKTELADKTYAVLDCFKYLSWTPSRTTCTFQGPPPTAVVPTAPSNTSRLCYPITHSYCQSMDYKSAFLPNFFGQTSLTDAYAYLSYLQALHDTGFSCHQQLQTLACSFLLPKCDENMSRVPPCKSLCENVFANCSYFLAQLLVPEPFSCDRLDSNINCTGINRNVTQQAVGCLSTEFTCGTGDCIPIARRCNGYTNCLDGSDETGCANNTATCSSSQMRCWNTGICIPSSWKCDGFNDCGDLSDEQNCNCSADQFGCPTLFGGIRCINGSQQCDGFVNCFDRSDERNCTRFVCRDDQFHCANGNCRPLMYKCDGDNDCGDSSDEANCTANEVCTADQWRCLNGTLVSAVRPSSCIQKQWRCDTQRDCTDGSDERDCPSLCASNPCKYGGNCTSGGAFGVACDCPYGTYGRFCQFVENPPQMSCDYNISLSVCRTILAPYHNNTGSSQSLQAPFTRIIQDVESKLQQCYNHSLLVMCQHLVPQCGVSGLPVLPCKHMCEEMKSSCKRVLNESARHLDLLINCDSLPDRRKFPDAECFSIHPPPNITASADAGPHCESLKIDYCKGLGYNSTFLPNLLNHTHQSAAELFLQIVNTASSGRLKCNPYIQHFGCAVAAPRCSAHGDSLVPPCRSFCQAVKNDCSFWLSHLSWNFPFSCDLFPESNDTAVCVPLPPPAPIVGCGSDQFQCASGDCIYRTLLCDSFPDCHDGSDEVVSVCGTKACNQGQFDCGNGSCIPLLWRCDTDNDCPVHASTGHSADEEGCSGVCGSNAYECLTGHDCIPLDYICDGWNDCADDSDEQNCSSIACSSEEFQCTTNGGCIPSSWTCDQYSDCMDGSDELNCSSASECGNDFRCLSGTSVFSDSGCVLRSWVCDHAADCKDASDEANCHPCLPNPCHHNGTCVEQGSGPNIHAGCICPAETTGANCQQLINPPNLQCSVNITINTCVTALLPYYNKTRVTAAAQSVLSNGAGMLNPSVLARVKSCSPTYGVLFFCGSELAGCQHDALPIMPCQTVCKEFKRECAAVLTELNIPIDCSMYPDLTTFPSAVCSGDTPAVMTSPAPVLSRPHCEPLKHPWCQGLGYNNTVVPNLVHQTSQAEAAVFINMFNHLHATYPVCHEALQLFICSVLAPPCSSQNTTLPKLPCSSLCTEVLSRCSYWLNVVQLTFPFNCSSLPSSNAGEDNCIHAIPLAPACSEGDFTCNDSACIPLNQRCDSLIQCPDASDESGCSQANCSLELYYRCNTTGRCIPSSWHCDRFADCPGGDDETNCFTHCDLNQFRCSDGTCIPANKRCDGVFDCRQHDDELCDPSKCSANEFRCSSGHCLPLEWRCDGSDDCPGNSAEDEVNCTSCSSNEVRCAEGINVYSIVSSCVTRSWLCDDEEDCSDGSDEQCEGETCPAIGNPCLNGATCVWRNGNSVCLCSARFTGPNCADSIAGK